MSARPLPKPLTGSPKGTAYITRMGALLIDTAQRPEVIEGEVTLSVTLSHADYKVLQVLQHDVAAYIRKLVSAHTRGLIKSQEHNKRVKNEQDTRSDD